MLTPPTLPFVGDPVGDPLAEAIFANAATRGDVVRKPTLIPPLTRPFRVIEAHARRRSVRRPHAASPSPPPPRDSLPLRPRAKTDSRRARTIPATNRSTRPTARTTRSAPVRPSRTSATSVPSPARVSRALAPRAAPPASSRSRSPPSRDLVRVRRARPFAARPFAAFAARRADRRATRARCSRGALATRARCSPRPGRARRARGDATKSHPRAALFYIPLRMRTLRRM